MPKEQKSKSVELPRPKRTHARVSIREIENGWIASFYCQKINEDVEVYAATRDEANHVALKLLGRQK